MALCFTAKPTLKFPKSQTSYGLFSSTEIEKKQCTTHNIKHNWKRDRGTFIKWQVSLLSVKLKIFSSKLKNTNLSTERWFLRAFASTRALRLFLRARAVINFVLRAASTLENTTSEQRTLHNFSANFTRRFIRVRLVPSLCDHFTYRPTENFSQIFLMLYPSPPRRGGRVELEELTIFCVLNANVAGFT